MCSESGGVKGSHQGGGNLASLIFPLAVAMVQPSFQILLMAVVGQDQSREPSERYGCGRFGVRDPSRPRAWSRPSAPAARHSPPRRASALGVGFPRRLRGGRWPFAHIAKCPHILPSKLGAATPTASHPRPSGRPRLTFRRPFSSPAPVGQRLPAACAGQKCAHILRPVLSAANPAALHPRRCGRQFSGWLRTQVPRCAKDAVPGCEYTRRQLFISSRGPTVAASHRMYAILRRVPRQPIRLWQFLAMTARPSAGITRRCRRTFWSGSPSRP